MKTRLMGILNVTPDSFFDGGKHCGHDAAVTKGLDLATQGADILDIGGESTRPGSEPVGEAEEMQRVIPVIRSLRQQVSTPLSIDTIKPRVAEAALAEGATFINDVSGFTDPAMRHLAASADVDICVMHMQGSPETMQANPYYPDGVIEELIRWFEGQVNLLCQAGVKKNRIVLDPGIGFGKTVAHNVQILQNLRRLKGLGFPLLLGVSRKSFMGRIIQRPASDLLPTTLAVNALAVANDHVDYVRVHDVAEHRLVIDLLAEMSHLGMT